MLRFKRKSSQEVVVLDLSQTYCNIFVQIFTKKRSYCRKYNIKTDSYRNPAYRGMVSKLTIKAVAYAAFCVEILGMDRVDFDLLS